MYLVDFQLRGLCEKHNLVSPYNKARVNPASVDLGLGREFVNLGDRWIEYIGIEDETHLGWRVAKESERFLATKVRLIPGVALLACTEEAVRIPDDDFWLGDPFYSEHIPSCIAELRLKSSAARAGLDHALAGWIDPGFQGNLTLELHAHRPIELIASKCYVQMVVAACLATPQVSYQKTGRYVGESAIGAVLAKETK